MPTISAAADQTTDAGLAHVQGLTKLRSLYLDGTEISDDGMIYLAGLKELRVLRLSEDSTSPTPDSSISRG